MTSATPPEPGSTVRRRRSRETRRSVRLTDRLMRGLITVGGLGTIFAISGVAVFLFVVVQSLFDEATIEPRRELSALTVGEEQQVRVGTDDYGRLIWRLDREGSLTALRRDSGETVGATSLLELAGVELPPVRSVGGVSRGSRLVLGFEDGTLRLLDVGFAIDFIEVDEVPESLWTLEPEELAPFTVDAEDGEVRTGVIEKMPQGRFRAITLAPVLSPAIRGGTGPVIACDRYDRDDYIEVGALVEDERGERELVQVRQEVVENFFTGTREGTWIDRALRVELEVEIRSSASRVRCIDAGRGLLVAAEDGRALRYRSGHRVEFVQRLDLTADGDLAALDVLLGGKTLIVADERGGLTGWFAVRDGADDTNGRLTQTKRFQGSESPVTAVATSERARVFVTGHADGAVRLWQMTTQELLGERLGVEGAVSALAMSPKSDLLLHIHGGTGAWLEELDLAYPDVSLRSMLLPVWYEGRDAPTYAWQTSAATDSYESKYSLIPLIFGSLKGTLYTMLISIPLALLAAIYTSEFLDKKRRAKVKPIVEMMASLPSVVLGFLAAVVIAPFAEQIIPGLIASAITLPATLLLGAYLWQSLPLSFTLERAGWRIPLQTLAIVVGLLLGMSANGLFETLLFAGDIRLWLSDPSIGGGVWGWLILTMPLAALLVAFGFARIVDPRLRRTSALKSREAAAKSHLRKYGLGVVAFLGLSALLSALFHYGGALVGGEIFDLRAGADVGGFDVSPIGGLDQRNALVVGFVMGFAIIPIIYTIAEDALSSVPNHLRAASLGAGATPWQTAVRVVVPTATSGLFSACMIGLGRAVGETMIVLMAAGNTPILKLNIFQGFQTLSAGIATELPEAPAGSTHYRTLFLAALVLFLLTFVINTVAEGVRLRFRRRFSQL